MLERIPPREWRDLAIAWFAITLAFTIESDGNVSSIKLLKSSGYEILDEYALNAVKIASPFNPIPASIGTKRLKITASFEYITSLYGIR